MRTLSDAAIAYEEAGQHELTHALESAQTAFAYRGTMGVTQEYSKHSFVTAVEAALELEEIDKAEELLEYGEWLVGQDRSEEAERLLAESRETFERLGATPWLERAGQAAHDGREREALTGSS